MALSLKITDGSVNKSLQLQSPPLLTALELRALLYRFVPLRYTTLREARLKVASFVVSKIEDFKVTWNESYHITHFLSATSSCNHKAYPRHPVWFSNERKALVKLLLSYPNSQRNVLGFSNPSEPA